MAAGSQLDKGTHHRLEAYATTGALNLCLGCVGIARLIPKLKAVFDPERHA